MKSVRIFPGTGMVSSLAGCASTPIALAPVGPDECERKATFSPIIRPHCLTTAMKSTMVSLLFVTMIVCVCHSQSLALHTPAGMALIPAGSFTMGDPLDGHTTALPLHTNYVSAFYMDRNLVGYALWQQVYQWARNNGYTFDLPGSGKAASHPVQTINWYDCVKWCNARSEMEGRTPAYYTSAAQTVVYRSGDIDITSSCVNWSSGYRLPTEAEWEKAARGGASGQRFPWGNTISWSQANYYAFPVDFAYDVNATNGRNPTFHDGVHPYTSPVGYFAPNGYGLYDMAGNVWQWCWDWSDAYSSAPQSDPRGPASGSLRVRRGGSWLDFAFNCRTAYRGDSDPLGWGDIFGFRSVLPASQP